MEKEAFPRFYHDIIRVNGSNGAGERRGVGLRQRSANYGFAVGGKTLYIFPKILGILKNV